MADKNFKVKNGLDIGDDITIADDGSIIGLDTDDLNEGTTNIYYTEARVDANFATKTTDALTEGTTNKYYSSSLFDADLATKDTGDLAEGTNLYYTEARVDANFATKDTGDLAEGTNLYYTEARVDANFATKTTDDLDEGTTNQYFTNARARQAISASDTGGDGSLSYDNSTGVITYTGPSATEVRAHFSGGTGVTITDGVVAIGQSVGTGDTTTFAGVSAGNISVGVATDNTIGSTDTNGNIELSPNGDGVVVVNSISRYRGELQATTNNSYTFPVSALDTVTDNNGYSAVSSFPTGTNGHAANAQYIHYNDDTLAGGNAVAAMNFRQANGNSVAGVTIPWTGLTSVAPYASSSNAVLGTLNFNGHGDTGFTNEIATQYQGGGISTTHIVQVQGYTTEAVTEGTKTLSSSDITAVASSFRSTMTSPSVVGTKGQIKWTGTQGGIGQAVRVTGTLTGNATGIVSGTNYWIIAYSNDGTFSYATLSDQPNGDPITTTSGTLTGLTLLRCGVTFTIANQTVFPFGRNALVTISGVNNLTAGTYPVAGLPTLTSLTLGVPHTTAPTLSGTQSFSCASITAAGGGFRVRVLPNSTVMNPQNRLTVFDTSAALTAIRSDAVSFNRGSYGGTGGLLPGGDISYRRTFGCFHKMANVTAAAADTVYAFDWTTSTTAHVNTQGITVSNTSRINFDNAGDYNVVIEMVGKNTDSQDRTAYVWLAKNGTDLAETAIKLVLSKETTTMLAKDWLVNGIADNDYIEVRFAVDTTVSGISLEYSAAQTSPYVRPAVASATITITPVGA